MARETDDDNEKVHFQMDRIAQQNGVWFYMTREGVQRGPFESREDAEDDLSEYIRHSRNMQEFGR